MRKLTDVEEFEINQGDSIFFEHSIDLGRQTIKASAFTLMASEQCRVVYTPISEGRVDVMRTNSVSYYREGLERHADKHGGSLTKEQIEKFFDKEVFYNRLRNGTD